MPSRLNEYPVGPTRPTVDVSMPACAILAIRRGSADSDDDVETMLVATDTREIQRARGVAEPFRRNRPSRIALDVGPNRLRGD